MTDIAAAIRRVEPRNAAKLIARDLDMSERHAKRIVAGDIPRSRYEELCSWLASRIERRFEELARAEADVRELRSGRQ